MTDHVADDNVSQSGSDEESTNPPTAVDLVHEVNSLLHLSDKVTAS